MSKINKKYIVKKILSILMLSFFVFSPASTLAQDLSEPIQKQIIQLTDEGSQEDWNISRLETYGLKFLVRGKEALTWSLNIEDSGFHNEAIEKSYTKVLTIVNSLFILGLLAIAFMWMFSILISRRYLKKVILVYSLAVIFINFALPINQLFIDGTNLLQKTLLTEEDGNIQITDIVQTPAYADVLSYKNQNEASLITGKQGQAMTLKITPSLEGEETTSIGKIRVPQGENINEEVISLNNQEISLTKNSPFSLHQEQIFFRFILLIITAIAYFIIALIFVFRIVILWALLILSPILLFLGIFQTTRGWFYNWLSMYGRWLLIGPLTALGIAVIVNIWQLSGLPISVNDAYSPEIFSIEKTSNILFYLPGKDTANTLSNTQEMMEYIIFLIMLYLPIFMAFALTRQKTLQAGLITISKGITKNSQHAEQKLIQQVLANHKIEEEVRERPSGIIDSFKHLMNNKIAQVSQATMPIHKMKVSSEKPNTMMPTASNFLTENLGSTPIPKMLELLGKEKGSTSSHNEVIKKLARTDRMSESKEKEKIVAVMNEIQTKAKEEDKEALRILHEVQTIKEIDSRNTEAKSNSGIQINKNNEESSPKININVNDSKPENDRKVRDKSYNTKNDEKNEGLKPETKPENENETKDKKEETPDQDQSDKGTKDKNGNKEEDNKAVGGSQFVIRN